MYIVFLILNFYYIGQNKYFIVLRRNIHNNQTNNKQYTIHVIESVLWFNLKPIIFVYKGLNTKARPTLTQTVKFQDYFNNQR